MYLLTGQKNKRFQMMALFIFSKYFLNCIFRAGIDRINGIVNAPSRQKCVSIS